ncbi:hypothetical protein K9M48_03670 [Candidatus Gracilibacteria bacterium]|nr:hypothetical protein [Candidatus Gracilibacteria bacterium]
MFNHKIIFRFFSMIFIIGLFFGLTNGACTNNFTAGSNTPYPSSTPSAGNCRSNAPSGTARYNNQNPIVGENALVFLKMFGFDPNLNCNASSVASIQSQMQSIGGACSTCIDGKAGNSTRTRMADCPGLACPSPSKPPTIENDNLVCELGYELNSSSCCTPKDCSGPGKASYANGSCPSGFTGDGQGCCKVENLTHQTTITANPTSFQDLNTTIDITVSFGEWVDLTAQDCNQITVTNIDTAVRNGNQGANDILDCETTVKPKDFQDIVITSPVGVVKYIDGVDSSTATETVTSGITGCEAPQVISGGVCECPDGGTLKNGACCTGNGTGEICSCSGGKVYKDSQCVCPEGKIDDGNGKCVCDPAQGCCGIELNTVVPFIGDCIEMNGGTSDGNTTRVNPVNAFPRLMGGLSRILLTVILVFSFVMVIVGGVMIITGGIKGQEGNFTTGKKYIRQVVIGLILLGASGIILRLINPNFFG